MQQSSGLTSARAQGFRRRPGCYRGRMGGGGGGETREGKAKRPKALRAEPTGPRPCVGRVV